MMNCSMACYGCCSKLDFEQQRARLCARLFADASRDGVYSHGLNRFPQFVRMIQNGIIAADAELKLAARFGSLERWDGKRGPGLPSIKRCFREPRRSDCGASAVTGLRREGQCDTQASTCCKSERKT